MGIMMSNNMFKIFTPPQSPSAWIRESSPDSVVVGGFFGAQAGAQRLPMRIQMSAQPSATSSMRVSPLAAARSAPTTSRAGSQSPQQKWEAAQNRDWMPIQTKYGSAPRGQARQLKPASVRVTSVTKQ